MQDEASLVATSRLGRSWQASALGVALRNAWAGPFPGGTSSPPVRARDRWESALLACKSERWRRPILLGLFLLNLVLIARLLSWPDWHGANDLRLWTLVPGWGSGLSPYTALFGATGMHYFYSPVAIWLIQPVAVAFGAVGFVVLQFVALLALPVRIGLIVAISWPFWFNVLWGNPFTLVFLAAFWAVRRNRVGVIAYIVLTLLMPRPVQLPLLAWLLWKEPWVRLPFVAIFVAHAALVIWSGYASDWLISLFGASGYEATMAYNFGPTRLFGSAWYVVGIPLALYLWRRHPAWAGLAIAPYVLGQYWLMVLADPSVDPERPRRAVESAEVGSA